MRSVEKSFADLEYESKKHKTRRELFLERMAVLLPWEKLVAAIKPYSIPKLGREEHPIR